MRNIPYITAAIAVIILIIAMIIGTIPYKIGALSLVVIGVWFYLFTLIKKNGSTFNF